MSGSILPIYRWAVSYNGAVASGAKAYFYLSGTNTAHDTYNNADLDPSHANTNPVVADSNGVLPIIYLDAVAYRVLITTSTGVTIFPAQDGVYDLFQIFQATAETANTVYAGPASGAPAAPTFRALVAADLPSTGAINFTDNALNDFRLTLTTAVPVPPTNVTAATVIYCTPYKGNRMALYSSTGVPTFYTSNEFSIAVPATTVQMYDIFCFASGGVPTLELLAWTNDTTRATAIVANVASGVYTKSGDSTRRYLGSFRTTGSSGQTEDSVTKRYLFNYYHRVPRALERIETTATWTYSLDTYQQANASTANQVGVVTGISDASITLGIWVQVKNSAGSISASIGIGLDSTTAVAAHQTGMSAVLTTASQPYAIVANYVAVPAVGYHFYAWLEKSSASGTTTWQSAAGQYAEQSGILGSCQA